MVYIYRTFYVSMEALRLLSSQCYKTILGVINTLNFYAKNVL
jgi:hypothetical protein